MFPYKSAIGFFIIQILKALALIKAGRCPDVSVPVSWVLGLSAGYEIGAGPIAWCYPLGRRMSLQSGAIQR